MSRKPGKSQLLMFQNTPELPSFASTRDEIKRAVERGAIHRGELLIKVITSLKIDELLNTIKEIPCDPEDIYERRDELNIEKSALVQLNDANPPIPYPFYFSTPDYLIEHPELVMYYRNVAMLSRKVMRGIDLPTDAYEDKGTSPSQETARELVKYFNGIISKLVTVAGATPNRHLEIALSNLGDALGGVSRNEVGRYAAAQVVRYLVTYWHNLGIVRSIHYTLKGSFGIDEEEDDQSNDAPQSNLKKPQILFVTPQTDITQFLDKADANRVKYQEITLENGYQLLFDRQLTWKELSGEKKTHKIGPDMISKSVVVDMVWAGEIKGGADPAGSDEHWKTATQALNRILEAAEKTDRPKPQLSLLATILVDRVAIEAQTWIDKGKLTSVYNLTKIAENEDELQRFLDNMTAFMGYPK